MNEHRSVKVARGKHLGDMREVDANLMTAGDVVRIVGCDFDLAPIGIETKMVGGSLVRESHHLIAAPIDRVPMPRGHRALVRGLPGGWRLDYQENSERCDAATIHSFAPLG